jgi:outer membrane lipoprotein-sorting protein
MRYLAKYIFVLATFGSLSGAELEDVLARMDQAAAAFQDVTANVEKINFTAIINDTEIENGEIWMSRTNGIRIRVEFGEPNPRSIALAGNKGEYYFPKLNLVNIYDLGDMGDVVDQFLLLGFGTSGRNLVRDYQVKVSGEEELGSVATTRLELVPKARQVRERFTHAELWVANNGGYPVRQKFHTSDGTVTLTYSDVEINPGLSPADLALDLPADVKREYPQR